MPTAMVAALVSWGVSTAVATFIVNYALSVVINKIFGPDAPDAPEAQKDPGVDTRVSPNTANKLPILYGANRVRGTIVMAELSSDNKTMAYILALGEGAINTVGLARWEGSDLTLDGDINTGLRSVTNAVDLDGVSQDFLNGNLKLRAYPNGGTCSEMNSFSSDWASKSRTMPNTPYIYIELTYDRDEGVTGLADISFDIQGKKIKTLTGATLSPSTSYSSNPAECIVDYMTDPISGLGLSVGDLDLTSFQTMKDFCAVSLAYTDSSGSSASAPRYTCNGAVNTNSATNANLRNLMVSCQTVLAFNQGKFAVTIDSAQAVTKNLGADDIIGGISITDAGFDNLVNELTLGFRSVKTNYKQDQVVLESPASVRNANEPLLERTIDLPFTNNSVEAERAGSILLNQGRASTAIRFRATVAHIDLEAGDIIGITDSTTGWVNEQFRIMSITEMNETVTTLEISAIEYEASVYTDLSLNERSDHIDTNLLSPNKVSEVSNLVTADALTDLPAINVSWSVADNQFVDHFELRYKKTTESVYETITLASNSYTIKNLEDNVTYNIGVRSFSSLGRHSVYVDTTQIVLERIPASPTNLTAVEEIYNTNQAAGIRSKVTISWDNIPVIGTNFQGTSFIIYKKTTGAAVWDLVGTSTNSSLVMDDLAPATYDFKVTPRSFLGKYGEPSIISNVLVAGLTAAPANVTNFLINPNGTNALLTWDRSTELDVLFGGTVQIRYNPNIDVSATWETSQILVESLSGTTTSKTVPLVKGTYFIKFRDSGGRESATAPLITNTFEPSGFNLISSVAEGPSFLGRKDDFDYTSGTITMKTGVVTSTYTFADYLDLGRQQIVRLTPSYYSTAFSRGSSFCDVTGSVCDMPTICGAAPKSLIRYEVRTADLDPTRVSQVDTVTPTPASAFTYEVTTDGVTYSHTSNAGTAQRDFLIFTDPSVTLAYRYTITVNGVSSIYNSSAGDGSAQVGAGLRDAINNNATPIPVTASWEISTPERIILTADVPGTAFTTTATAINSSGGTLSVWTLSTPTANGPLDSVSDITLAITNAVNAGTGFITAADTGTTVTLTADYAGTAFTTTVGSNLTVATTTANLSPVWSAWIPLLTGNYRHRAFEFRVISEVSSTNDGVAFTGLSVLVDTQDTRKSGTSTSLSGGDETVTFADEGFFAGLLGTTLPSVAINIIGGSSGDNVVIASRSATTFTFSVYNGGSRVVRTVDWQAIGQ